MFRGTEQGHKQQGWDCETWDRMKTLQEAEQAEAGRQSDPCLS